MFSHNLRLLTRVGVMGAGATVLARVPSSSVNSTSASSGPGGVARCEAGQGGGGQAQLHRAPQQHQHHHHHQHEQSSSSQHHALESYEKDSAGFVGVFLDAASVEKVQNAVGGTLGRNAHALIHLHPDPATKRSFAPLFGSKARVLVHGVAEDISTHQKVIIAEVSVGANPHNRVVPSRNGPGSIPTIAIASDSWDDDVSDLLSVDLARRMMENGILHVKGSWDGVLPAQVLDGIKYPATRAIFTQMEEVLALEGTVCASTQYDKNSSQCVVNREGDQAAAAAAAAAVEEEEGEEEKGECPLCTYMMGTPCKDVFVVFKACIDKAGATDEQDDLNACHPQAVLVSDCIQKHGLFTEGLGGGRQEGDDDSEEDEDISAVPESK